MSVGETDTPEIRHWFDTRTGDMIVGSAAYEDAMDMQPAYPDEIRPLADILTSETYNVEDFSKNYPKKIRSTEEYKQHGAWVLSVLHEIDSDATITVRHFDRIRRLGLGMSTRAISVNFPLWKMREELGVRQVYKKGRYETWTLEDFINYSKEVWTSLGRKPTRDDYNERSHRGEGPNVSTIFEHVKGGLSQLHEFLGFPDIYSWSRDDYIDWGVRAMVANGVTRLSSPVVEILSKRNQGPSRPAILSHFPDGVKTFFDEVSEEYYLREAEYAERIDEYSKYITELQELFAKRHIAFPEKPLALVGRYKVIQRCLPIMGNDEVATLARNTSHINLIKSIQSRNDTISAGHIESVAHELGLQDDIWPPHPEDTIRLRLTTKEKDRHRKYRAAIYQRSKKKASAA